MILQILFLQKILKQKNKEEEKYNQNYQKIGNEKKKQLYNFIYFKKYNLL